MKKFAFAASIALLALASGCNTNKDTDSSGRMGMVSCPHGKDCTMSCCKDGMCKDGTCNRYRKDSANSGNMGMVSCARGKDCGMSCCSNGMCKDGTCKAR